MNYAPEFSTEGEEWLNGGPLSIKGLKGKVVLIKFWTFMCSWCQQDLPKIMALGEKYHDKGLVLVGIHTPETSYERDTDALKGQIEKLGVTFPVLTDNSKNNWGAYGAESWPSYFIVNKDGKVAFNAHGPDVESELEEEIIKAVAQ